MAFGLGFSNFSFLKPENDEEMQLVFSIGKAAAEKHGKNPSSEIKQQVQEEISGAIQQSRSQGQGDPNDSQFMQPDPMGGMDMSSSQSRSASLGMSAGGGLNVPELLKHELHRQDINPYKYLNEDYPPPPEQSNEDFGFGDFSTFDKIAGGAGLTAAVLGAFGVGGRSGRNPLGAISKYGLGRAMSAPQRFRDSQDRENELEVGNFERQNKVLGQNVQQDQFNAVQGMNLGSFGLRAATNERIGGNQKRITEHERLYRLTSYYQREGIPFEKWSPDAQSWWNTKGSPDPDETKTLTSGQLSSIAGKEFDSKQAGFQTQFEDYLKTNYRGAYDDRLQSDDSFAGLAAAAKTGEGGLGLITEKRPWYESDIYGPDPQAAQLADSAMFYRDESNKPPYQLERAGNAEWVRAHTPDLGKTGQRGFVPGDLRADVEIPPSNQKRLALARELGANTVRKAFELAKSYYDSGEFTKADYDEFIRDMKAAK